jgi:glycosyltransferase involved in cell wall biosynthesis
LSEANHCDRKEQNGLMKVAAIVLTYNEELHIERCLESLESVADVIFVVDSFSTDRTVELAEASGAKVLQHPFNNHAAQFNWGVDQLPEDTDWVVRLDADEYLGQQLREELKTGLAGINKKVAGVIINRNIVFSGKKIRYGGVLPVRVLRVFRYGRGRCENRLMDEYIVVDGETVDFDGEIIDNNLNSLTWWTAKHNSYASLEAVEQLNLKFGFMDGVVSTGAINMEIGGRRWFKEKVYSRLPAGSRAFAYFVYRYIIRFGFLDGRAGAEFHFLQGFWYRYLVDAKVHEVLRAMKDQKIGVKKAIEKTLALKI